MRSPAFLAPFVLVATVAAQQGDQPVPTPAGVAPAPTAQEPVKPLPPKVDPTGAKLADPNAVKTWFPRAEQSVDLPAGTAEATAKFPFANPTGKEIEWKQLTGSCTCTSAKIQVADRRYELKPKPYELVQVTGEKGEVRTPATAVQVHPGEAGEIEIHMDTHGLAGVKMVTLDVHTTDPGMPMARLQLTARGAQPIVLTPAEVDLGRMSWGQKKDFTVRLTSPSQKEFDITGHDPFPKEFAATWTKAKEGDATVWTIQGAYGPIESGEGKGCTVRLATNVKGGEQVMLKVLADVKAPFSVSPGLMTLGIVRRGKPRIETIKITPNDDTDLQAVAVRLENLSLDAKLITTRLAKDGKNAVVEVEFAKDVPSGLVSGELVIELNHPTAKEHRVRFNGYAR